MDSDRHLFSESYVSALRRHVSRASPGSNREAVRRMGERAARLRLTADELAGMHMSAQQKLLAGNPAAGLRRALLRKSGAFFKDVSLAAGASRGRGRSSAAQLTSIVNAVAQRAGKLAASNEKLRREIVRRKSVEESLRVSKGKARLLLVQSRRLQRELRHLSRQLLSAQEEERKRISRELHDIAAQALSSIQIHLALLKARSTASVEDLHLKIAITQKLVQKSVEIVHRFARDLRPAVLDDLGLIPALDSHFKRVTAETGTPIAFRSFAGIESLGSTAKTVLYRICQQALTNIVQHAKAKHVQVVITRNAGSVRLVIRDDGCGFRQAPASSRGRIVHLGLLGMRERAEMIGGTFSVQSAPGKPTRISVILPAISGERGAKQPVGRRRRAQT